MSKIIPLRSLDPVACLRKILADIDAGGAVPSQLFVAAFYQNLSPLFWGSGYQMDNAHVALGMIEHAKHEFLVRCVEELPD